MKATQRYKPHPKDIPPPWLEDEPTKPDAARLLNVTFLASKSGSKLDTATMTPEQLLVVVLKRTATNKAALGWIKLAAFGGKRTKKGSLRHDKNVVSLSGVEMDYDGEKVSFDEAVAMFKKANLFTLIYTSPSNAVEKPRWRVLLPVSADITLPTNLEEKANLDEAKRIRLKLAKRVNGVCGGIFSGESFTLSQGYFFGSVNNNPAHRAEIVEGDFIDLRHDLDATAMGKQKKPKPNGKAEGKTNNNDKPNPKGFEAHLARMGDGAGLDGFNAPLLSATCAYAVRHGAGLHREAFKAKLREAIVRAPKKAERDNIETLYLTDTFLDHLIDTAIEKYASGVSLSDLHAYMPMHSYVFEPTREMWPASSVNARIAPVPLFNADDTPDIDDKGNQNAIPASAWLDRHRPVEQMTWAPGLPLLIRDRLISDGGWIERPKVTCLNLYRPPTIVPGNAAEADRWIDHVYKVYPTDADHIVKYLAQRVQHPEIKPNHAIVLGGPQGIGKDTALEPAKQAVGPWNFSEVSPQNMLGRFNGFLKSVILRVSEARDLGDVNRYQFYDHMKSYTAAPPDVLRVDEKHLREHSILNCCGVIITTNHKADGIFLPADDRRHYVAWSDLKKEDFVDDYWNGLWQWYASGGDRHVAAYLAELDLSGFDPKAPPKKTEAFWDIVNANRAPEDAELSDVLDGLGSPLAVTLAQITNKASGVFFDWIIDRKNRRAIPHRMESCGYVPVRNEGATDGYYVIGKKRCAVYAKAELAVSARFKAASELANAK